MLSKESVFLEEDIDDKDVIFEYSKNCNELKDILNIANPIIKSEAFKRLNDVSFLGILSPQLHHNSGLYTEFSFNDKIGQTKGRKSDSSRGMHSLGVAIISLIFCKRMQFNQNTIKYAIVWGLLHDIATWQLSHTGEPAFSTKAKINPKKLREAIIMGSELLPEKLSLKNALDSMNIDIKTLMSLINKDGLHLDEELNLFLGFIRSPITPDTLEGIYRTGKAYGIEVPLPTNILDVIIIDVFKQILIKSGQTNIIEEFWKKKSLIYKDFINKKNVMEWESSWSKAIEKFLEINILSSDIGILMEIPEIELINKAKPFLQKNKSNILRYKYPLKYTKKPIRSMNNDNIDNELKTSIRKKEIPLDNLSKILVKTTI